MKAAILTLMFAVIPTGDPTEVGFDVLSGFDYVEGEELPEDITGYNGKSIKVSGFMRREDAGDGPTSTFMLVNDACGCDGTPKLNEIVFCAMPSGDTVEISASTITVTGTI